MDADLFDNEIDSEPFDVDDDRNLDNFEDETPAIEEAEHRERTNPDSDAGTTIMQVWHYYHTVNNFGCLDKVS